MNRYRLLCSTQLTFVLIFAASVSTARSDIYDPYGLQYHYKPWGQYGPEFTAPNIPRIVGVLEGRAPLYPHVARRMVPSRSVRFSDVNLSVTMPHGPWVKLDPKQSGSHSCFLVRRSDPTIYISLAAERVGEEAGETNSTLLAASRAKMKGLPGGSVIPGERALSADGIDGIAYGAKVTLDGATTYYAMWVASQHGYDYKLAVYGDQKDEAAIDAALLDFVRGVKQIQPRRVAHSGGVRKTITR